MKILEVIPSLETGGAQKLIEYFVPYLMMGNEVAILVFKKSGSEIEKRIEGMGITIHSMEIGLRSPFAIKKMRPYIQWADVVHAHLFPSHYYLVIANQGIGKPIVFTEHSTHNKRREKKYFKIFEKFVYRHLNKVACISVATKENLLNWLDETQESYKFEIIINGVDLATFQNLSRSKPESLFGKRGKAIIMVSRFTPSKDHATAVRALKFIPSPDVFLVFVGEGETLTEIKNIVKQEKVENRVIFLGNRSDIPILLKSSFIGLQSSNWEGFGLTVIEEMAAGLPVIVSNVVGVKDIVDGAGLLFEKGNHLDLASQINYLIKNKDFYEQVKERCIKRADEYSIKKTADRYLEIFNQLIQ
ncbi:MAG: glycosyltransferase [Muribaculaceae bacterium]|nr:glycosyltransferase [Muribaculaceae bacterium]